MHVLLFQKWKDSGGKVIGASLDKDMEPIPIEEYSVEGPILLVVGRCTCLKNINW